MGDRLTQLEGAARALIESWDAWMGLPDDKSMREDINAGDVFLAQLEILRHEVTHGEGGMPTDAHPVDAWEPSQESTP